MTELPSTSTRSRLHSLTAHRNRAIQEHFDRVAITWDDLQDSERLQSLVCEWLAAAGIRPHEAILDVGCGTGLSTGAILSRLSSGGRVYAIDLSSNMLQHAASKHPDARCSFIQGAVQHLPLPSGCADRALAFSAWPHFEHLESTLNEIWRILKPGGTLHIWHHDPRTRVDEVHLHIGGIIAEHLFPQPEMLLHACQQAGFSTVELVDNTTCFRLTVLKMRPEHP